MDTFEVGGKHYQVAVTHEDDGTAELAVQCEGSRVAALLIDEIGVYSVILEQCLVVARR